MAALKGRKRRSEPFFSQGSRNHRRLFAVATYGGEHSSPTRMRMRQSGRWRQLPSADRRAVLERNERRQFKDGSLDLQQPIVCEFVENMHQFSSWDLRMKFKIRFSATKSRLAQPGPPSCPWRDCKHTKNLVNVSPCLFDSLCVKKNRFKSTY